MYTIFVELSEETGRVDSNYELIIIMSHLNHDGPIKVKNNMFLEDTDDCDGSHGFLSLTFSTLSSKENAINILKKRGYYVIECYNKDK